MRLGGAGSPPPRALTRAHPGPRPCHRRAPFLTLVSSPCEQCTGVYFPSYLALYPEYFLGFSIFLISHFPAPCPAPAVAAGVTAETRAPTLRCARVRIHQGACEHPNVHVRSHKAVSTVYRPIHENLEGHRVFLQQRDPTMHGLFCLSSPLDGAPWERGVTFSSKDLPRRAHMLCWHEEKVLNVLSHLSKFSRFRLLILRL